MNTSPPTIISKADETAIRELLANMAEAWANGDGHAYGELFRSDAHYVTAPGERVIGRQAIADAHQKIFDSFFRHTRLGAGYPAELQPLTSDIVLVHGSGAVLFRGEEETNVPPNGLMTMVVIKQNDTWKIAAFNNTQTGKGRNMKFFWRYIKSRLAAFGTEWTKARKHMLDEKQQNIAKWKNHK